MAQVSSNLLIAALVVVEQADKILLVQEAKAECRGKWFLPGGRMTGAESVVETAVREAKEESGIGVELFGLLYVDELLDARDGSTAHRLRFVFVAKPVGGQLKQEEDEHSLAADWFSSSELEGLDTRSPLVARMVALHERRPGLLPISSFRLLSGNERG